MFSAEAGVAYYVVLEGTVDTWDTFYNVSIQEQEPESFCDDFWDDDFDGFLDCDDPDCQGTFECDSGPGAVSDPCFTNNDCEATANGDPICLGFQLGFDGGYCSEFCDGPGDCPDGGVCKDINISAHGVCYKSCVTTNDCPPGTECNDDGTGQFSCDLPPELNCQDYADNDFDSLVDCEDPACATSSSCVPGVRPPGEACQLHSQCAASSGTDPFCIDQFHEGWPGGYCSEYCDMQIGDCPAGSKCTDAFGTQSGSGTCMKDCVDDLDCRAGYLCNFDNVCAL